jgi:PAS domain S-box-containing protein
MHRIARTLLIVDDSPEDLELYRRYLLSDREYSYTILEASLGQQGLDLWQQHQLDAMLVDYRLPDMDGLEFLSHLHFSSPDLGLPVIVVTGQGNEAIAVQAIKAGAQDYLVKGQLTPERLQLAVNGAIKALQLRIQLQQRIDRERLVLQIIQKIQRTLDLEEILQATVTEVRQFLHVDRVLVFRLEPEGNGTVVAESVGAQWRSLFSSTIYDPCLADNYLRFSRPESVTHDPAFAENYVKRYRQGQVTAISDIHNSDIDPCHVELLAQFQVQANLVVPIVHDDRFWGLLIAHHCSAPRLWQPLEIDLLKELVAPVSIALRQAELYQRTQRELVERQRVEAELRESEERFRQLAENIDAVFWIRNIPENRVCYVSPAYERLWGLNPKELYEDQQIWVNYIHPDDRQTTAKAFQEKATIGQFDVDYRIVLPDGSIRWVHDRCFPVRDRAGNVYRLTGIAEDQRA